MPQKIVPTSNPSAALKRLKAVPFRTAHAILWLVHRTLRSGEASYRVSRVDVELSLEKKLLRMIENHVERSNVAEPYEFESTDQDERMFVHSIDGTDFPLIAAEIMKGLDAPKVKSVDEYVVLMNNLKLSNPKMMDVAVPANMKVGLHQAEVARRGGVVGVSFYRDHLRRSGRATLDDVVRHMVHHARAAGGPEHIGIGTDVDGGFDSRYAPFDDLAKLKELRTRLRAHFNSAQVEGVMGENWLEFLGRSLPD